MQPFSVWSPQRKLDVLRSVNFGGITAEEEYDNLNLKRIFVKTDHWQRVYGGEVDIIYGPKGSGKSAFYWLLEDRKHLLLSRFRMVVTAEELRGATAFRELATDPLGSRQW
jgi:hypothetical protein